MIHIKLRIWNWNLEYETMKLRIIFLLMHRDSTGKQRVQKNTIHPSAEGTAVVSNVLLNYCPPVPWYWQLSAEDTAVVSNVLLLSSHAMILTAVCWRYCCGQQCPPKPLSSHAMILTAVCWRYCCGQQWPCPPKPHRRVVQIKQLWDSDTEQLQPLHTEDIVFT